MFGYFTALTTFYWFLAQEDGGGGSGLPVDLGVFGVAGTTVAILLYFIKILWGDNKELRGEINTIQTVAIERVATIATQSSTQLQESAKTLKETTDIMNKFAGSGISSEQASEINYNLRALRERRSD